MNEEQLEEILDSIESEPELQLFFKKLFVDPNYHKIFFLQKEELFPTENGNSLTYLFLNNLEAYNEDAINILLNQAELKSMRAKFDQDSFAGFYTEGIEDPLKDLIMYIVIQYVRENPEVKKLIDAEKFDYSLMKQSLRDYKKLDSKIFDQIEKIQSGAQIGDPDLMKLTLSLSKIFESGTNNMLKYVGDFLPSIAQNRPEIFFQIHANYKEHLKNVLKLSSLSKLEYSSILKDAYSQKNIFNVHSMFWCPNCLDENIIFNSDSSIHPSHLHLQCPRCSKNMLVSAVFQLDGRIEESIMNKDGLIKVATAWQLRNNEIEFDTTQDEEYEYDFVCKVPSNNMLIECRLHKSKDDDKTIQDWMRQDLSQLSRHYNKIKESHEIKHPIFLTNLDVNKNRPLIEKIKSEYAQEIIYAHTTALPLIISKIKSLPQNN